MAGRTSVFDNDFYLDASSPTAIPADAPAAFRASVVIMHILIQLPRLVCLLRYLRVHPNDTEMLAKAISLAETLWTLDPYKDIDQVIQSSTTVILTPPAPQIADIVPDSLHFDSIDSAILISRYWMLMLSLCGVTENLHLQFPNHTAASSIPDLITVQRRDIANAIYLARCAQYGHYTSPELPILPLRLHTTVQLSMGPWRRLHLRLRRAQDTLNNAQVVQEDVGLAAQIDRAIRMENWIVDECSRMHTVWDIGQIPLEFLQAAADNMAGGPIPHWLPTTVKLVEEDGDIVMKVQYEIPGPRIDMLLGKDDDRISWNRSSTTVSPFGKKR
jgi:hypothetical protein